MKDKTLRKEGLVFDQGPGEGDLACQRIRFK